MSEKKKKKKINKAITEISQVEHKITSVPQILIYIYIYRVKKS